MLAISRVTIGFETAENTQSRGSGFVSKTYAIIETIEQGRHVSEEIRTLSEGEVLPANSRIRGYLRMLFFPGQGTLYNVCLLAPDSQPNSLCLESQLSYVDLQTSAADRSTRQQAWQIERTLDEDTQTEFIDPDSLVGTIHCRSLKIIMPTNPLAEVQVNSSLPRAQSEQSPAPLDDSNPIKQLTTLPSYQKATGTRKLINQPMSHLKPTLSHNDDTDMNEIPPIVPLTGSQTSTPAVMTKRNLVEDTPATTTRYRDATAEDAAAVQTRPEEASALRTSPGAGDTESDESNSLKIVMKDDTQEIAAYNPNDIATAFTGEEPISSDMPSSPPLPPTVSRIESAAAITDASVFNNDDETEDEDLNEQHDAASKNFGAKAVNPTVLTVARPMAADEDPTKDTDKPTKEIEDSPPAKLDVEAQDIATNGLESRNASVEPKEVQAVTEEPKVSARPTKTNDIAAKWEPKRKSAELELDEGLNDNAIESAEPPKKRGRKSSEISLQLEKGSDEAEETQIMPSKRRRKRASNDLQFEEGSAVAVVDKKESKKRGRKAAGKNSTIDAADENLAETPVTPKRRGRPRKSVDVVEVQSAANEEQEHSLDCKGTKGQGKKSLKRNSTEVETTEQDEPSKKRLRSSQNLNGSQLSASARVTEQNHRVLFSNSTLPNLPKIMNAAKSMGVEVIEKAESGTFDVLAVGKGELKKTSKLLLAVALGKPVVFDEWLSKSVKAKKLLATSKFAVHDAKRQKEWGYDPTNVSDRGDLLQGMTIHVTPALKELWGTTAFSDVTTLAKALGAKTVVVGKYKRAKEGDIRAIALGLESGDGDCNTLLSKGETCYNRDLITISVLRGTLDLDSEEFVIKAGNKRSSRRDASMEVDVGGRKSSQRKGRGRPRKSA